MAKKAYKFPKELLVTHEEERDGSEYLTTHEDKVDLDLNDHGKKVAVYKLVGVKTLNVKAELT